MTNAGMFVPIKHGMQCVAGHARLFALAAVLWLSPGFGIGAAVVQELKIGGNGCGTTWDWP